MPISPIASYSFNSKETNLFVAQVFDFHICSWRTDGLGHQEKESLKKQQQGVT
jgi:hypothetical protein